MTRIRVKGSIEEMDSTCEKDLASSEFGTAHIGLTFGGSSFTTFWQGLDRLFIVGVSTVCQQARRTAIGWD